MSASSIVDITLDSLDHGNELTEKQIYWLKSYIPPMHYSSGHQAKMRRVKLGIQNAVIHYYGTQAIHQQCYQTGNSHCVEY